MTLRPAEIAQGPMFVGIVLNVFLYGITVTQTFLYFMNFRKDKLWIKCFVGLLCVADTVNTVFDLVYLYNVLIVHFADLTALGSANWVFATDPALTGFIAMLVQLFFAWRVKILTANNWIVALVVTCALAGGLGGLATAVAVGIVPRFTDFRKFKVVVIIWLAAECVGDIVITTSLVSHLRKHKTGFKVTDNLVNRIITMTVQTGMITSICAIIDLILFLSDPTGLHLVFNMPLAKLYSNSLMSSLNCRAIWKHTHETGEVNGPNHSTFNDPGSGRLQSRKSDAPKLNCAPGVFMNVEAQEILDTGASDHTLATAGSQERVVDTWDDKHVQPAMHEV